MLRTYPLQHAINKGKQQKIIAIAKEYRKLAVKLASLQWQVFYQQGDLDKNLDVKEVKTPLSQRYKQTCQYQVVGVMESFITNRQKEFVRIVCRCRLEERTKRELFYLNKHRLWFVPSAKMSAFDENGKRMEGEVAVEAQTIRLARCIFKHVMKGHRRPRLERCNLALDSKVAVIRPRSGSGKYKAKQFDYWIMLSTLEPRKTIYLPLISNAYFEEQSGPRKNFCQINIGQDGHVKICLIKDVEKRPYVPEVPKIALDFGLRNLFATDRGDLYGRHFMATLQKYDGYISSLAQNRQRQGLRVKSRIYEMLVNHLRSFLQNEICRVINRIVETYHPQEIVVESLDFRSPHLSRRLNRLLANMGRKVAVRKFQALEEELGIKITQVPAPYSSQTCYACSYVDENNRPHQSTFICRHCHKTLHADVNGARNVLIRSSNEELSNVYLSKSAILDILIRQFLQRYPQIEQDAAPLLASNRYFRQYRQDETNRKSEYG